LERFKKEAFSKYRLNSHKTNLASSKQNRISLKAGAVSKQFILFLKKKALY